MIKITLKDRITYDIVEENKDVYFYIGNDGYQRYVKKNQVVNVEEYNIKHNDKQKKSLLLNIVILALTALLVVSQYL